MDPSMLLRCRYIRFIGEMSQSGTPVSHLCTQSFKNVMKNQSMSWRLRSQRGLRLRNRLWH
jgi:hypothetical protein